MRRNVPSSSSSLPKTTFNGENPNYHDPRNRIIDIRKKPRRRTNACCLLLFVPVILIGVYMLYRKNDVDSVGGISLESFNPMNLLNRGKSHQPEYDEGLLKMMKTLEHCTVPTPKDATKNILMQQILFPYYPYAISEKILKRLVKLLTGLDGGAKSYYSVTRRGGQYRCKGPSPTALCMMNHPVAGVTVHLEEDKYQFSPMVVMGMRNPLTAFPVSLNNKISKARLHTGQIPVNEWRELRDKYDKKHLEEWKRQIETWQQVSPNYYHIEMYLAQENLMDYRTGPDTVRKLSAVLNKAGFHTFDLNDSNAMACAWYQGLGKDSIMHYARYKYEFTDYRPLYKAEQHDVIQTELESLKNNSLPELLNILDLYIKEVKQAEIDGGNTKLEK